MFKAYIALFKGTKYVSSKSHFAIHLILFNIDYGHSLLSCNTCNNMLTRLCRFRYNHCSLILWAVGVLNIYRYACCTYRENCIFM